MDQDTEKRMSEIPRRVDMDSTQQNEQEPKSSQDQDSGTQRFAARDIAWQRKPMYSEDPRLKSPMIAAFLSLVPGLGQVYVGYYGQGFINIIVIGTLISLLAPGPRFHWPLTPLLVFFLVFYWLYNIVDAARRASFYNQAVAGMPLTEMPSGMRLPGSQGSLVGGILLILAGVVIASRTIFGYSLEWLQHWWPLAPILFGAYLVFQSLRERSTEATKP
jgi:hypothetical protein